MVSGIIKIMLVLATPLLLLLLAAINGQIISSLPLEGVDTPLCLCEAGEIVQEGVISCRGLFL